MVSFTRSVIGFVSNVCDRALYFFQKQPSRGVLRKRYSESIQQIYRRKPMQSNFIEISLRYGCSPVNLLHISRTLFTNFTPGLSSPLSLVKPFFLYTCSTEVKSHPYPYFTPVLKTPGVIRHDFNV